jgi:aminoglycoside 3-N-acetyltransferase
MAHYTTADLDASLASLPLEKGDVLFLHSNIGFFGRAEGVADSRSLCELFFDALMRRVGHTGTLVVPVFTYSFPRREVFDPVGSASEMGMFAEWVRMHPEAVRSCDPCYSVAAIGAKASQLTEDAPENSFSPESFFGRFYEENGIVLNLNFDAGSTFLHYLERELQVPYRFDKTFEGYIREHGSIRQSKSTIYVRYMSSDSTEAAFEPFHKAAVDAGIFQTQNLGRGRIGSVRAADCRQLLERILPERPWLLTRADMTGLAPLLVPESDYQPL